MPNRDEFRTYISEHADEVGFQMPKHISDYLIDLCTDRLDKPELIPEPSFGERWLNLQELDRAHLFQEYADQCLFFVSLMPEYGKRRGLDIDYYASLGISSYYTVGDKIHDSKYVQLGNWFYHLQKFLNSAIRPKQRLILLDKYL